jgi:hypothetical protein
MSNINRMQDELEIALGIWLIAAPWLLGYAQPFGPAAVTSSVVGLVVALMSLDDYFFETETDEWIDAVFGIALALSPWLLGYTDNVPASVNAVACGLLITGVAAWAVKRLHEATFYSGWHLPRF